MKFKPIEPRVIKIYLQRVGNSQNNLGFSLIQVIAGIALGAIVLAMSGQMLTTSTQVYSKVTVQTTVDTLHMQAIDFARSSVKLRSVFSSNAPLMKCFSFKGSGCPSFNGLSGNLEDTLGQTFLNATFNEKRDKCASSTITVQCPIKRTAQYSIHCIDNEKCDSVTITVLTEHKPTIDQGNTVHNRSDTFKIPAIFLNSRAEIDFSCAANGNFVTTIDYTNLKAQCDGFASLFHRSPNEEPITIFGVPPSGTQWQLLNSFYCPQTGSQYGIATLGLFVGQGTCSRVQ